MVGRAAGEPAIPCAWATGDVGAGLRQHMEVEAGGGRMVQSSAHGLTNSLAVGLVGVMLGSELVRGPGSVPVIFAHIPHRHKLPDPQIPQFRNSARGKRNWLVQ